MVFPETKSLPTAEFCSVPALTFIRPYLSNGRAIGMVVVVRQSVCLSVSNGCIVAEL